MAFKIVVPKVGAADKHGATHRLYEHGEVVEAGASWEKSLMSTFVENNWAIEIKTEDTSDVETGDAVRARNEDGHYIADDPSTPEVNEAYEGGKAPAKKKRKKRKTTKKKASKKS